MNKCIENTDKNVQCHQSRPIVNLQSCK